MGAMEPPLKTLRRELARALVENQRKGETALSPGVLFEDVPFYIDPARFPREEQAFFRAMPLVACLSAELPEPGSYRTFDDAGVPVAQPQPRHQADAETGRDEALSGGVVLALDDEVGAEAGRRTGVDHRFQAGPGRLAADPLLTGELVQVDDLFAGERVTEGQYGGVRVVEEVDEPEAGADPVARLDDHGQVGPAPYHLQERVLLIGELKVDSDAGVLGAEPGEGGGHQRGPRRGEVTDRQAPGASGAEVGEGGLRPGDRRADQARVLGEQQTGGGGPHPAADPFEQCRAGLSLQRRDLLADG